jgi:lysophospholipase L1-like esterase
MTEKTAIHWSSVAPQFRRNVLAAPVAILILALVTSITVESSDKPSATVTDGGGATDVGKKSDLKVGSLRVNKVLILGNSVAVHGPAPHIGWTGDWGMAASAREKDFAHRFVDRIAAAAGGVPELRVKNIADFERKPLEYDLQAALKSELEFAADVVVVAIGQNAPELSTEEEKDVYRKTFANLLAELKRHGQPVLFVRGEFWPQAVKNEIMKQVCEATGGVYVDIDAPARDEANLARSERTIEHAGVAGHPGDKGMQVIADGLWKALEKRARSDK